jgi:SAM-dependent methyltransferase
MLASDALATASPTVQRQPTAPAFEPDYLAKAVASLRVESDWLWAWENYKRTVQELSKRIAARRLIEIGGGRGPLFNPAELNDLGVKLTVNDIAPGELALLPAGYDTACFDVVGDLTRVAALRGSFDLAFSRMVFEHVADGPRAWSNLYELLAPGGIALAFIPTLYALPFVLNWIIPDKLAAAIVKAIRPDRNYDSQPVFPARYSWCFADEACMKPMLSAIGYREVAVLPFYGHSYYGVFPVIRDVHHWFTGVARRRDWRMLASFAYVIARK